MGTFQFFHSIEVRYADLDPQGHLNNACYLTYFEVARIHYLTHTGLWDGQSFLDIGIIIAHAQVNFLKPIFFGQKLQVGARVSNIGNKSFTMEYSLQDTVSSQELANGSTVVVAYDQQTEKPIPIPDRWRKIICAFEGLEE